MENASKALLISGGILIAILVISIGVYMRFSFSDVATAYDDRMTRTRNTKCK